MDKRALADFHARVEKDRRDIWRYADFYDPKIDPEYRLTLGEGWTTSLSSSALAAQLGLERLYFKREDLNPTGSHKARSLAYQVSKVAQEGRRAAVISSSGNAAVAAAAYARISGITLLTFVSPRTNPVKLREIARLGAVLVATERPINLAKYASTRYGLENLRPSTNDSSIEGFKSLGFEIFEAVGEVDAVFTFVSSGSSLLGLARAYRWLAEAEGVRIPALHAVHSGALSPASEESAQKRSSELAGGLGVKRTRRARSVLTALQESGGQALLTDDDAIRRAADLLAENGILTSAEGVASFGGLCEIASKGGIKSAVCILTGHSSQWPIADLPAMLPIETEAELDVLLEKLLASETA